MWRRRNNSEPGGEGAPRPSPYLRRQPGLSLSPFRPFHLWKGRHFAPVAGVLVALLIFLVSLTPAAHVFELRTLDMRFQHRGARPVKSNLAVVFIGDDGIRSIGRWPWPWDYHALLVDILKRHGAKAVLFDVIFAEPPSPADRTAFPLAVKSAGNVYFCAYFQNLEPDNLRGRPVIGTELTEPIPDLKDRAMGLGHTNALPDEDGITRRIPMLIRYSDGYYPSSALQVALDELGVPLDKLDIKPGAYIRVPVPGREPIMIPMDDEGQTPVNFMGDMGIFEQYSYLQILQADRFPDKVPLDLERVRGKIVLVGVTFTGNTDLRPTPLSKAYPMILILGNTIDNILQHDFVHRASLFWRLVLIVSLGAVTGFLAYVLRPIYSLTAAALLMTTTVGASFAVFNRAGIWTDLLAPLGVILANYLAMTTVQYVQNRKDKMHYLEYLKYMNDLVGSTNDAIISFDRAGTIVTWNKGAEKIMGWTEREALGKKWDLLAAPEERDKLAAAMREVSGWKVPGSMEITGVRKGGQEFPASLNLSPVEDSRGVMVGISCIGQDHTERKKMVELLIQSEKMAELGRLGSGIVHEIKNPLTSIMMLSGMVLAMQNLDPKAQKYISIIDQEAQRILRLSQNILSFARPKKPEMKPIELNRIIEETLSLVEYELKKNKVALRLGLAEGGVTALGDDEKLKQVFLNLIINAIHAMEGGGNLEITTGRAAAPGQNVPEGFASHMVGSLTDAEWATVAIRDEGSGIRADILSKIFEPFFTTKAEGKGTGLGLYICRNIILEHHGLLSVASQPGRGTIFSVALPLKKGVAADDGGNAPAG